MNAKTSGNFPGRDTSGPNYLFIYCLFSLEPDSPKGTITEAQHRAFQHTLQNHPQASAQPGSWLKIAPAHTRPFSRVSVPRCQSQVPDASRFATLLASASRWHPQLSDGKSGPPRLPPLQVTPWRISWGPQCGELPLGVISKPPQEEHWMGREKRKRRDACLSPGLETARWGIAVTGEETQNKLTHG